MMNLVIVGRSGVGKSYMSKIAEKHGFKHVRVSDVLRQQFDLPEDASKPEVAKVAFQHINRYGEDWLAPVLLSHMERQHTCLDGLRIASTFTDIKSVKPCHLVYITDCSEKSDSDKEINQRHNNYSDYFQEQIHALYFMAETVLINTESLKTTTEKKFENLLCNDAF